MRCCNCHTDVRKQARLYYLCALCALLCTQAVLFTHAKGMAVPQIEVLRCIQAGCTRLPIGGAGSCCARHHVCSVQEH